VRMPYRFSDAASGPVRGVPEPGEHTDAILRDWTGHPDLRTAHPDLRTAHPDYQPGAMRGKPDSSHTGITIIVITGADPAASAMKPRIQCVRTHWNPGFIASGVVDTISPHS